MAWLYLFLLIGFIVFISACVNGLHLQTPILTKEQRPNQPTVFGKCTYLGGLSGLVAPKQKVIIFDKDKVIIKDFIGLSVLDIPIGSKVINFEDIISFDIISEHSIKNDVTLTRLITLGVFAFALKKQSIGIENYFIIKFKECNEEKALVLQHLTLEDLYNQLRLKYDFYMSLREIKIEEIMN